MKYFIRGVVIVTLLILIYFNITIKNVIAKLSTEQIAYDKNTEERFNSYTEYTVNSENDNNNNNSNNNKVDIYAMLEKFEKFNTEHTTENGENYAIIGSVKIPKIDLEHYIFSKTSETLLNMSINRYWGANPNEVGNMCLIGHNYNDDKFFANLNQLNIGDKIEITDEKGRTLNYSIYDKYVISPYDTSCTSQLTNGETEITLITCHNYGRKRLVLKARTEKDNLNIIKQIIKYINN